MSESAVLAVPITEMGETMSLFECQFSRRLALAGTTSFVLEQRCLSVRAESTGTVVGADEIEIRGCPSFGCAGLSTVQLAESVTITGEASDGFLAIRHGEFSGYVPDLYVATDLDHVPYLLKGRTGCQRLALIFNVGIGDEPAAGILETLVTEQAPATMFVMGWWAEQHPAILTRIVDAGFVIGSHGFDPIELTSRSDKEIADDIERAAAAIEHVAGEPPARIFTPYSAAADDHVRSAIAQIGYLPVAWEVAGDDYGPDATEHTVFDRVVDGVYDGAIVELHLDGPASAASTAVALPRMIATLREQGYRFVTIPEMIEECVG